jgi:hypothetical protein
MNNNQLEFDLKECDEEYSFGKRNVLKVSEIKKEGFIWTQVPANITENNEPYITLTYDMGIYPNVDYKDIPQSYKQEAIKKMKNINMKYVFQVYFGEIFIDPTYMGPLKNRWNHIFARGYCIKKNDNKI